MGAALFSAQVSYSAATRPRYVYQASLHALSRARLKQPYATGGGASFPSGIYGDFGRCACPPASDHYERNPVTKRLHQRIAMFREEFDERGGTASGAMRTRGTWPIL
jgi:hypothetical protein